jgi:hypothetical protein
MGFTRKILSLGTAGLVDFRPDKERIAAYTKGTRRAARKQAALLEDQNRLLAAQHAAAQRAATSRPAPHQPSAYNAATRVAGPLPAGWYTDPAAGCLRWWDGARWTEHTHPLT